MRYVRFVVASSDARSQVRKGIFQALFDLDDERVLDLEQQARFRELSRWFDVHLPRPARFARARTRIHGPAICWFKDTAEAQLVRARELVVLLREQDVAVEQLSTARPGYIVYEDNWQVAAEPFRDTGA